MRFQFPLLSLAQVILCLYLLQTQIIDILEGGKAITKDSQALRHFWPTSWPIASISTHPKPICN